MTGFTSALEAALLDHVIGKATYTPPANWFVALYTTTPTADDGTGGTESTGGAYARVSTAAADWNSAATGDPSIIDNLNAITFATATDNWGTINGVGLFTISTGGTVQMFQALTTPKAVGTDDALQFAAGALDLKLGDTGDTY